MVSPRTITVSVEEDGNITIETSGFEGTDCLKETMDLEQALGTVSKRTQKSEMYRATKIGDKARIGGK